MKSKTLFLKTYSIVFTVWCVCSMPSFLFLVYLNGCITMPRAGLVYLLQCFVLISVFMWMKTFQLFIAVFTRKLYFWKGTATLWKGCSHDLKCFIHLPFVSIKYCFMIWFVCLAFGNKMCYIYTFENKQLIFHEKDLQFLLSLQNISIILPQ